MNKLQHAQEFLKLGIAVIPLRHRGKEPEAQLMGGAWEQYKTQLPTEYDINRWLYSGWQNYGVVAGWGNLAMIDFDTTEAFEIWQAYFKLLSRVYDQPYIVRSARGAHVYVRMYNVSANQKRRGVDVKVHGYCVGPGSIHPSGATYTAIASQMAFPDVFDLETILPTDLFPPVVVEASTSQIQGILRLVPAELPATEYDAFAAASGGWVEADLLTKVKASVRIEDWFTDCERTSSDGRWLSCRCPFHDDNRPSFWIDTVRQLCGCQVCEMKPMDAVNLYARMHNVSDSVAVNAMAAEIGVWR